MLDQNKRFYQRIKFFYSKWHLLVKVGVSLCLKIKFKMLIFKWLGQNDRIW